MACVENGSVQTNDTEKWLFATACVNRLVASAVKRNNVAAVAQVQVQYYYWTITLRH